MTLGCCAPPQRPGILVVERRGDTSPSTSVVVDAEAAGLGLRSQAFVDRRKIESTSSLLSIQLFQLAILEGNRDRKTHEKGRVYLKSKGPKKTGRDKITRKDRHYNKTY